MTWQPRRGSPTAVVEGIDELAQALALLLESPRGSRPHDPDWGSELWRLVDAPLDVVRTRAPAEVARAAALEPRIVLLRTVVVPLSELGGFELEIHWRPAASGGDQVTRVRVS